ncbi:MAG TPA: CoB--CoM heterodisulfide reductase iron-sulfur subunit B family protein [Thermoplasmata archaeon]|nr:CoB--CoM heterodisulfide reductase iron-sulfur subunit B family protein [Thermoplasmata archaeon]
MRFAYFPGCAAQDECEELDESTRAVAKELRIELVDLEGAACCGAGDLQRTEPERALAANAGTLSLAQAKGLDILTVCGACQLYLSEAAQALEDPDTRARINHALGRAGPSAYGGGVRVKHLLQVLLQDVGEKKLAAHVRRPLGDVAVGAFYGCRLLRAPGAEAFDTPADPKSIERLVRILGGNPLPYRGRTACCGFDAPTVSEDLTSRLSGAALAEAKDAGATMLATPCPLCHLVLDAHQKEASKAAGRRIGMPILHLPQLAGLAFGIDPGRLGVGRHTVSVAPVIGMLEAQEVVKA